jgi:hypothetical protein
MYTEAVWLRIVFYVVRVCATQFRFRLCVVLIYEIDSLQKLGTRGLIDATSITLAELSEAMDM